MKRTIAKLLAGLLAASLLLAGCGNDTAEPSGSEPGAPRGRYIETKLAMPEDLEYAISMAQMDDGELLLFGLMPLPGSTPEEPLNTYRVWSSKDDGGSWQIKDYPWYPETDKMVDEVSKSIDHVTFVSAEELYFSDMEWVENTPEDVDGEDTPGFVVVNPDSEAEAATEAAEVETEAATEETGAEEEEEPAKSVMTDGSIVSTLNRATASGLENLGHSLLTEYGSTPDNMLYTKGGLLLSSYDNVRLLDYETGEEKLLFPIEDNAMTHSLAATEDRLIIAQASSFLIYDLATGDRIAEIPLTALEKPEGDGMYYSGTPSDLTAISPTRDGSAVFYLNATGLYRATLDGSITEKLMDGDLNTIGMPSIYVRSLFQCADGSFLVAAQSSAREELLFRYAFDPSISSVPSQELGVYSLGENQTVRQAIGQLQKQNADVKVNYRVGLVDETAVTAADALRTLSTEMLAGNGPDVLVLDGIPVDSYIEKGALKDLSGYFDGMISSGELIPGVAESFRRDGKLYAIPARFSVPMMQGVGIGGITDFQSLTDWLGKQKVTQFPVGSDNIMDHFYDMLSPGWFGEDGSLDHEAFAADLERLKAIKAERNEDDFMGDLSGGAVALKSDWIPISLATVSHISDFSGPYSLIKEIGEGEVELFPEGGVFVPGTVMGINAATSQEELATEFIAAALTEDVQLQNFSDGMPVNDAALVQQSKDKESFTMAFGTSRTDPETGEYQFSYIDCDIPSEAIMSGLVDTFRGLTVPSFANLVVKDMVIEAGTTYLKGAATLEATVDALKSQLDLYLAE